jgi:CRP-like cAMP-binding protein
LARKVRKKTSFDPKLFLATVDGGRSVANYRKNEIVFSQGDPADAVFYVREGKIKLAVKSKQGKQAVVAIPSRIAMPMCGSRLLTFRANFGQAAFAEMECAVRSRLVPIALFS